MSLIIPKNVDNLLKMKVFIEDPNDEMVLEETSQGTPIDWVVTSGSPDGVYKMDIYILVLDPEATGDKEDEATGEKGFHKSDSFRVINRQIVPNNVDVQEEENTQSFWQEIGQKTRMLVATVMDCFVTEAQAADLRAESASPYLVFDDTDDEYPIPSYDWWIQTEGGTSDSDTNNHFTIYGVSEGTLAAVPIIILRHDGGVDSNSSSIGTMVADYNGDIYFADGGMFFDRSKGYLAIGRTTNLLDEFTVCAVSPEIALWDSTDDHAMHIQFNDGKLAIEGNFSQQDIVVIDENAPANSLVIDDTGSITNDWYGSNSGGDGLRTLMNLQANNTDSGVTSDVGFSLLNDKEGFQWNFRTSEGSQGIAATKQGTGGGEFVINNSTLDYRNVSLSMGNGASCSSSGQWIDASSREYKENIDALGTEEAMETFKSLTPVKYSYKNDDDKELNVGFIAEEVPQLVATKHRKGMNSMEVVALLTKVVQEQQNKIQVQQNEIQTQQKKIDEMQEYKKMIEALSKKIEKIEKVNSLQL